MRKCSRGTRTADFTQLGVRMSYGTLSFYYGVVGAGKTLLLLYWAKQYGRAAFIVKPAVDTRFGAGMVKSRAGVETRADLVTNSPKLSDFPRGLGVVLVDEAQFFSADAIDVFRELADKGVNVQCFGLRTDYEGHLFDGAKRLFEVADEIHELTFRCAFCAKDAKMNLKTREGNGKRIELDASDLYRPVCHACYAKLRGARDV